MNATIKHQKITILISLVLAIVGIVKFLRSAHSASPYSANILVLGMFWLITFFSQIGLVAHLFVESAPSPAEASSANDSQVDRAVGWHFIVYNVLTFFWGVLVGGHHYITAELVLVANFLNILSLYFVHKTYTIRPFRAWVLLHVPVAAFPLSWIFYAIFWNGSLMLHFTGRISRLLANLFIWDFLIVPLLFLELWGDWAVGLSTSILMLGVGLGQMFVKVIALQWIFAFVIAGVLFAATAIVALTGELHPPLSPQPANQNDPESAPLLA